MFFAILLYIAENKITSIQSLWSQDLKKPRHSFATHLMSLTCFELMYSCFQFKDQEMEEIESFIVKRIQDIWIPSSYTCCDESIVPYKGHKTNPHHVFIMRKPHPHGVKVVLIFFDIIH